MPRITDSSYETLTASMLEQNDILYGVDVSDTADHATGSSKQIPVSVVRTDKGSQVYNIKAFGAFCDGSSHPLSAVYGTLGAAQVDYPTAVALTDEFDQVALEKALATIPASGGTVLMPPGINRWTRTLNVGDGSATNVSTRRGQHIIGAGAGATHSEMTPLTNGTRVQWYGSAGLKMLWVKGPTSGVRIEGIMFECMPVATAAGTAVYQSHVMDSVMEDVVAHGYSGEAFVLEAYQWPTDATYGCAQGASGNVWRGVRAYAGGTNSTGLRLGTIDTIADPNTGALELDVNNNTFINCDLRTTSTTAGSVGLSLCFCDNNTFVGCWFDAEAAIRITPPSTAVLVGGVVTGNPVVTAGGVNYTGVVTVTFKGGGGSGATATAAMGLGNVIQSAGGSGYTNGTNYALGIAGGGGAGGAGLFDVVGGAVTNIRFTTAGTGYTSQPTLSFPGAGAGSGAAATAYLKLVSLTLTSGGSGYVYRPSIVITGGGNGFGAYAGANYWPQSNSFVNCPATSYLEEDGWTATPNVGNFFMPWQTGDTEAVPSPQALSFQAFTFGGLTLGDWNAANTYNNAPKNLTATPSTASGSVAAGTYYFQVCAYDGQGFSLPSADIRAVLSGTGKIILQWSSVIGATAYRIYKGTATGRTGKNKYFVSTDTYYEWTTDTGATTVLTTDQAPISPQTANYKLTRFGGWVTGKLGLNRSDAAYSLDARGGGLRLQRLATPAAAVVTPVGTAGVTTYSYWVVAEDAAGFRTMPSPIGSTTTGNATLSSTNYNRVEATPIQGALKYYILKKLTTPTAGGTESILLATLVVGTDPTFVNDTGQTLTTFTNRSYNETAQTILEGPLTVWAGGATSGEMFTLLDGTGANPKYFRNSAGVLQIYDAATANVLFQLDDVGNLTLNGSGGAIYANNYRASKNGAAQAATVNGTSYVTGSGAAVPFGRVLAVGSTYRAKLVVSKTAAGTATKSLLLKIGTTGTTSDATIATFSLPAGTAVADFGTIEVTVKVLTVGASATLFVTLYMNHNLATTGLINVQQQYLNPTATAFDSTVASLIIGLAFTSGTSEAWTWQEVNALLEL